LLQQQLLDSGEQEHSLDPSHTHSSQAQFVHLHFGLSQDIELI